MPRYISPYQASVPTTLKTMFSPVTIVLNVFRSCMGTRGNCPDVAILRPFARFRGITLLIHLVGFVTQLTTDGNEFESYGSGPLYDDKHRKSKTWDLRFPFDRHNMTKLILSL